MIVVGGSYSEAIVFPRYENEGGGSARRALDAIGPACEAIVTALSSQELDATPNPDKRMRVSRRTLPVRFHYVTPISTPSVLGREAVVEEPLAAESDTILAFGMVERVTVSGRAKKLVIDPQSPRSTSLDFFDQIASEHRVLSVNSREAANLVGGTSDPATLAAELLQQTGVDGVVLRAGARGTFISTDAGVTNLAPHPTQTVWSLGSGDTFSAAFAFAWGEGRQIVEAAEIASNATAWWCGQREQYTPTDILSGAKSYEEFVGQERSQLIDPGYRPQVYLGGPFFNAAEHLLLDSVASTLAALGARPFSPFHHVGTGGQEVARKDIDGLRQCDAMLALLDHYDPGTVFEAGWAVAHGIPVIGHRSQRADEGDKMLVGLGAEVHDDLTSALYRSVWAAQGATLFPGYHTVVPPSHD